MTQYRAGRRFACVLLFVGAWAGGRTVSSSIGAEMPQALILEAGNAEDDAQRLEILRALRQQAGLDPSLASDVDKMVAFVERWIGEPSLYRWWDGEVRRTLDFDFGIGEQSPLYPLTCLYRGRMLVWATNEYGNIISYHDERRRFLDKAVKQFQIARQSFPENRIVRMYLGEPIPTDKQYVDSAGAPEWAALQREGLERLADIVTWWIDHRLRDNGEYGGAWDDDCEMWRHWVPVLIAFDDPKITRAQAFFSQSLLRQSYMQDGYTSRTYDVEHTAEPSTDTITPMMHLAPDDPAWTQRATRLADLMETIWTGRNERGFLQFKSTYFNARAVDPNPERACDTPYHVVAIQPALLLWQRTHDERLTRLFGAWFDTWVEATARAERGKPAGIIPAAIQWPGGTIGGPGPQWWDPRHHGEPTLYQWPSAVSKMTDSLLLAWHITGEDRYLNPIRSMAAARLKWLEGGSRDSSPEGSEAWCASRLGLLASTLTKFQLLSGSREFDKLLRREGRTGGFAEDTPDRSDLAQQLRRTAEALRINFAGYTSEVRYTDRVFTFPRLFGQDMLFADPVSPNNSRPDLNLLYTTATGDRGGFEVFPLNAVRWLTVPREIAALVTFSGRDRFSAELFHFGAAPRAMSAELYLLAPGNYTYQILGPSDAPIADARPVAVAGPRTRIEFELPPRQLCKLRVTANPAERGR